MHPAPTHRFPTLPARYRSGLALVFLALVAGNGFSQEEKAAPGQAKAAFDKADKALNEAWAAAKAALPEADFNKLKEDQKQWVGYRDYLARSPIYTGGGPDGQVALDAPEYLTAAAALEEERTQWLKGLVRKWDAEESLTGIWSDSYGGTVQIVEQGGKLHFIAECVRGPTSHLGEISGIAAWNESIGWFGDKASRPDKERETNLCFILRARKLEIIGANTGEYHGMRAYFDGDYVKTGKLSAEKQAAVIQAAKTGERPGV